MEPLQKLLDNLRAVLGKVREQAFKATSQEATKISLAYSQPPVPSGEDCQKLSDGLLNAVLAASALYYSLRKEQGTTLRKTVREAVADVIEGTIQLIEVILSSRIQSLSQAQLVSTGSVWEACDQFAHIPKDNHAAVTSIISGYLGVVKDALEEMEQAVTGGEDPFSDILEDDEIGARGNQDTYWSEADHRLIAPCLGLIKASKACLKKVLGTLKAHGKVETAEQVAQLDDLADITQEVSPSVDELALSMYPPMNHVAVRLNAAKLSSVLKKVLEITSASHVCPDTESSWVQFLHTAIDHNMNKVKNLTQDAL
ncbi:cyclin-D1-binding protein 1 isoform X2 [Mixophyes fleayi]|uniref:cyclin-D1-binding protein 1 isoform X2 n=1 Tax=Mixophyes fleayi TaxID=3061075 RepID=UPI003F4DB267